MMASHAGEPPQASGARLRQVRIMQRQTQPRPHSHRINVRIHFVGVGLRVAPTAERPRPDKPVLAGLVDDLCAKARRLPVPEARNLDSHAGAPLVSCLQEYRTLSAESPTLRPSGLGRRDPGIVRGVARDQGKARRPGGRYVRIAAGPGGITCAHTVGFRRGVAAA